MRGWLLASVDGQKVGIIPANYVKVLGKKRGSKHQQQAVPGSTGVPSQVPTLSTGNSASTADLASKTSTCCSKKSCDQSGTMESGAVKPAASAPCLNNFNSMGTENNSSFANLEDAFTSDSNSGGNVNSDSNNLNAKDILEATGDNLIN